MRHELSSIGHVQESTQAHTKSKDIHIDDFVLDKCIFLNIFEKDIRRIFIYKKSERLAKAILLIAPAFSGSVSLKNRIDAIALNLIDAATVPHGVCVAAFSRELLTLSSVLSLARTGSLLSPMNAEIVAREAHALLKEVASYEEPQLALDDIPTLSTLAKGTLLRESRGNRIGKSTKGHVKDTENIRDRRESIMSVIRNKKNARIKDISTIIRGVSEKTIQRELSILIEAGIVLKEGERRWSTYSLAS